jgi:hypothetical protein
MKPADDVILSTPAEMGVAANREGIPGPGQTR